MNKFGIGQAVRRVEDQRFLTGAGAMSTTSTCRGSATASSVLSPHAHARIRQRRRRARPQAAPGVLCVLTGADAAADKLGAFTAAADAGGRGRAEGPPHVPAAAGRRQGALRRRPRRLRRRRDAWRRRATPPSWSRSTTSRCRPWCTSRTRRRTARRRSGTTARPATSPSADVRQQGRDRRRLRQGEARGVSCALENNRLAPNAMEPRARDRRLQRGRRRTTRSTRARRIRTACAWSCRTSFHDAREPAPRGRRRTSAAASA